MKLIPEADFPELQRHSESGIWYVRKFITGKGHLLKSTKERHNKVRAKTIALKILSDFIGSSVRGYIPLFQALGEEVIQLKAGRRLKTRESMIYHIRKRLIPFFGHMRIDQIQDLSWEAYITHCEKNRPGGKLFNDRKHMVMVMRRAWKKGLLPGPLDFRNPDSKTKRGKVFSNPEIQSLLDHASPELRIQILMAVRMGMRRNEILLLSWDRVDLKQGVIHLYEENTKTKKPRSMAMDQEIWDALKMKQNGSPWVFPCRTDPKSPTRSHKTSWTNCRRNAGVSGTFHHLRHTFLTRIIFKHHVKMPDASAYAGVSQRVLEEIYLHPEVEDTRYIGRLFKDEAEKG